MAMASAMLGGASVRPAMAVKCQAGRHMKSCEARCRWPRSSAAGLQLEIFSYLFR